MMSDDESGVTRSSHSVTSQRIPAAIMPLQLNNPSQVSSNIARMVNNIIPQIEQEINEQVLDTHGGADAAAQNNPFTAHGRQRHSQHGGRTHGALQGHGRSLSHGQALYHHFNNALSGHTPNSQPLVANQSQVTSQTGNPTAANQQPDNAAANHNFVIDFGGDDGATVNQATVQDNNNNGRRNAAQANNPMSQLRQLWKHSEGSIPFVILLLVKILYDHRLGILVLVGLYGTFYHANSCLKRQIAQRDPHGVYDAFGNLIWIISFLVANIVFIYYVFDDQKLYRSLYFTVPELRSADVWVLLWIVGINDFVVKYASIVLKACITLQPKAVLPVKKKGKYYMLIEVTSQTYRSLIPIVPWLQFLVDTEHGGGTLFAYILCGTYIIFKATQLYGKTQELRNAVSSFRLDVSYGSVPTRQDLSGHDNCCPICQDKLTDPVKLSCSHIFCEDCVAMWFDREKTCPMCRAQIVDNPKWRDGSTSSTLVMF